MDKKELIKKKNVMISCAMFFVLGISVGFIWGYASALNWVAEIGFKLLEREGINIFSEERITDILFNHQNNINSAIKLKL